MADLKRWENGGTTTSRAAPPPAIAVQRVPASLYRLSWHGRRSEAYGVNLRAKLSRDTGVNLTAAECAALLDETFEGEGGAADFSRQTDPGCFYTSLGVAIENQTLTTTLDLPDHPKVAWFCCREAAEVHKHPGGMRKVAECYYSGQGVTEDPTLAVAWFQKAADLGDAAAKAALEALYMHGFAPGGVEKDASRAVDLLSQAAEQGESGALFPLAECYLRGDEGVEMDAVRGVALLQQCIDEDGEFTAMAQAILAMCYMKGVGVEADTTQAAFWCLRAATGGSEQAIEALPLIRTCTFCGKTPARKHCERCRKVRYCDATCQRAHWNHETNPHKGQCRRAAETSPRAAGGASTSVQTL